MVDSGRIKEFWSSWQQPNANQEIARFRNRMLEAGREIWDLNYSQHQSRRKAYAMISGTPFATYSTFPHSGVHTLLTKASSVADLIFPIQCLLWTAEREMPQELDYACRKIQEALEFSPTMMVRLVRHGNTATLYPAGARLLDAAVVESTLVWLSRYPDVLKPFENALKLYATKDAKNYRGMLDNLRFATEQMLQSVLSNKKTLENQKSEFQTWLKDQGMHVNIVSMYHTLLFGYFTQYQNDAVKHHEDDYTAAEVEFLLYVTGTFLRLIQRLLEQKAGTKAMAQT
jgi:hypothetical protein